MPCLTSMLREFLAWISRAWVSLRRDWLAQHARQRNLGLPARVEPHFCVVPPQILHRGFPIPPIQADSNPDLTAEYQSKTGIKPTRFVHRSSWLPPTSIPIFPHQKAKKSRHQQHLVSYNPDLSYNPKQERRHRSHNQGKQKPQILKGSAVSSCARGELNPHSITGTRT